MIFKRKKEEFFLNLEEGAKAPETTSPVVETPAPEAAAPAPKAAKAPKAKAAIKAPKAKTQAPDPSEIIAAAVKAAPAPVAKQAPAPKVEPVYEFFPSRRRPGPSLQGFMEMARNMGRS